MTEPAEHSSYEVSADVARLGRLLRVAADTTRLLASAAGPKEPMIMGLASRVDEVADAFAALDQPFDDSKAKCRIAP